MNTVKHFKDLGLEFVADDEVDNNTHNKGIDIKPLSEVMAKCCNDGEHGFYGAPVGGFAWRKNTGEKPAYKGEIEVKHRDGDIILWRPLLNQPEPQQEKPIYTQEMADANELVPLGVEFLACGAKHTCVGHHVDGGVIAENELAEMRRFTCEDCKPLRTQRDIEIDLIKKVALIIAGGVLSAAIERDVEEIYKMGYRVTKVEE